MREQLLYYAYKYKGDYKKIYEAIKNKEEWKKISYEGNYICILDELYPNKLKRLKYPPFVLFYEGDISLIKEVMIAVIGSRDASIYGKECTKFLVENLHSSYGIISGVAKGIDAYAHQYALQNNVKTIGVLGNGIDVVYPKENEILYRKMKEKHLLISEYPNGCKPYAYHFPWRNRIIAALSEKMVVVEAKMKSGTMITVGEALELGIPIYAFPHSITNKNGLGCNRLIEQGCNMLNSIDDIREL